MTQDPGNRPNPETPNNPEDRRTSRPQTSPSLLKRQTIKLLRGTIAILQTTLDQLEADPTAPLLPPLPNSWRQILRPIRILLPGAINRQISDWGLTGAIATLLLVVVWSTISLSPDKPTEPVAQLPPQDNTEIVEPPPESPEPEFTETPELPEPEIAETPPESTDLPPLLPSLESPDEFQSSDEEIPELEPESLEKIAQPPDLNLSPEEILIASIQDRVAAVTSEYADGIIKSIQANFRGSILQITVDDTWYDLPEERQTKLANKMWHQAQQLDFRTLEMLDRASNLVARSPVVGSQTIVLLRRSGGDYNLEQVSQDRE